MARRSIAAVLAASLLLAACAYKFERLPATGPARVEAPTTEAGRSWSFRLVNGYNGEVVRHYREELVAGTGPTLRIVRTDPSSGESVAELYTRDWKWLSKARPGFNAAIEYSPALEALPFPLEIGKSWSQRAQSKDPQTGHRYPVQLVGRVVGWEKIKVPAGMFDAILVRRTIYVGDGDFWRSDTEFLESDWYAPMAGRVVRSESASGYYDLYHSSPPFGNTWVRGDWNVLELVEPVSGPQR